jgi:UDP-N-acetylglucosamine 2-epimerase
LPNAPKRVLTVVGARPQFVKLLPLSRALRRRFHEAIVHTGQHYDDEMSRVFFEELSLPEPSRHLGVGSGPHGAQTGLMLTRLEEAIVEEKPDVVIVLGDTNSTLAGALAASKLGVPLAHVEAGVRGHNRREPEEQNRIVADHLSDLLFVPTADGVAELKREGITRGVHRVGDVMLDAIELVEDALRSRTPAFERFGVESGRYALATFHRAANVDDPVMLEGLIAALAESEEPVIFPVHPRTRARLAASGLDARLKEAPRVRAIEPVGYLDMLSLVRGARVVVTDSGGLQKECYLLGVPCVTADRQTAWAETVRDGWNVLVPPESGRLGEAIRTFRPRGARGRHYGDGRASERIAEILARFLGEA